MENKIITILLADAKFKYMGRVSEDYFFSEDCKNQFKFIVNYSKKYKALPTLEIMLNEYPNLITDPIEEGQEEYWLNKFIETKQKLQLKKVLEEIIKNTNTKLPTGDIEELVTGIIDPMSEFRHKYKVDQEGVDWVKSAEERKRAYEEKRDNPEEASILTNIRTLDDVIGGMQLGDLFTVAGFSGTGKTWFLLYLAIQAFQQGKSVLIYSLEMQHIDIARRLDTFAFNISNIHINTGTLDERGFEKYSTALSELQSASEALSNTITIYDSSHLANGLTADRITSDVKKHEADIVIVDQLSLMKHTGEIRQSYIKTTRELKQSASTLKIPIVLAVQMNRNSQKETEVDMTGIAESNAIAENSDKVLILKRPPEQEQNTASTKLMNIHIAKIRNNSSVNKPLLCLWDVNMGRITPSSDTLGDL